MTPTEQSFTNGIRIEAIKKQIFEYKYRIEISNNFCCSWWYTEAIKSLEARMSLYK